MKENLINFIINLNINKSFLTFLISMLPILEIRGALPISIIFFKLSALKSFVLCALGNIFIIIPFMIFVEKFLNLEKYDFLKNLSFFRWWISKTKKNETLIKKYGTLGLLIFVAIPLPSTGAYTGALLASLLKIKKLNALYFIALGVIIAGIITLIITKGITLI